MYHTDTRAHSLDILPVRRSNHLWCVPDSHDLTASRLRLTNQRALPADIARILGFYFRALQPLPKGSIELPMRHRLLRSVLSVFLHCLQLFSWQPLYDNDSSEPSPSSSPFSAASAELSTIAIGPEVALQFGTSNPEQATLAAAIVYSINVR